jgi:hypothetical protein
MPHHRATLGRTVVAHPCRQQAAVLEIPEQADGAGPSEGKLRIGPMLGFKRSRTAPMTLEGSTCCCSSARGSSRNATGSATGFHDLRFR